MSMDMRYPKSVEDLWADARDKLAACPAGKHQVEVMGTTEAFADLAWRVLRLERALAHVIEEGDPGRPPVLDLPWHSCADCNPSGKETE